MKCTVVCWVGVFLEEFLGRKGGLLKKSVMVTKRIENKRKREKKREKIGSRILSAFSSIFLWSKG